MINATQMAKPFGKPVSNFLRLKESKDYILLLESRYSDVNIGESPREVFRIIKGGNNKSIQSTWMDEKLALKFGVWLSCSLKIEATYLNQNRLIKNDNK